MPFDEEDDETLKENIKKKSGLKKVSSQKSIFDDLPKKPSSEEFNKKVTSLQERSDSYKVRGAELATNFFKILDDKTLKQNKSVFAKEFERELINSLVNLSIDINNDPAEKEGMGSLAIIVTLLKTSLMQRDKINNMEYELENLKKELKKIRSLDVEKKNE